MRSSIRFALEKLIRLGLEEDLGLGDVTTESVVPESARGAAALVAREALVVSGVEIATEVFRQVDPALVVSVLAQDGDRLTAGAPILRVEGSLRSILMGERLALNFLGRLSGIATHTRRYVDLIAGTGAQVVDTRKTTPGYRMLEKAAVSHGGGGNHRSNLGDGILIKDNHIEAVGSVRQAIRNARKNARHHLLRIEVEVDSLEQLVEALDEKVDIVLLDNMGPDMLQKAVAINEGRAILEASGGIRFETIEAVARTGVNLISVGNLIHGARWVDVALDVLPMSSSAAIES